MPAKRTPYKQVSLSQLKTLLVAVEKGSFTAAGKLLKLSTTTVWEQVRALETQYGVELFVRDGRRVVATKAGRRLAEMVAEILAAIDSTKVVLPQEAGQQPEQLTVVCGVRMFLDELCGAFAAYRTLYPNIRLNILQSGSDDIGPLVANGEVDLAITPEPSVREALDPRVDFEVAYESEYLLVLPPDHLLVRKRVLELPEILEFPLIIGHRGTHSRQRIEEVLHQLGLLDRLKVASETGTGAFTIQCVRAGMGLGICGGTLQGMLTAGLGVRSLRRWFGASRNVFCWKRGAYRPYFVQQLKDCIRDHVRADRDRIPKPPIHRSNQHRESSCA